MNEESRRVPTPPRHRLIADIDPPPNSAPPSIAVPSQTDSLITPVISPPPATTPSVLAERKAFGAHPPPPTRTIALGDKLPPARRQPSGSSSDEEEEVVDEIVTGFDQFGVQRCVIFTPSIVQVLNSQKPSVGSILLMKMLFLV